MPVDPALARDVIALFEKHAAPAPPNTPFYHSVAAVGMGRYHGLLVEAGFETLREVKEVEVADLMSLGMPGFHAAEMLAAIPAPHDEAPAADSLSPQPVTLRHEAVPPPSPLPPASEGGRAQQALGAAPSPVPVHPPAAAHQLPHTHTQAVVAPAPAAPAPLLTRSPVAALPLPFTPTPAPAPVAAFPPVGCAPRLETGFAPRLSAPAPAPSAQPSLQLSQQPAQPAQPVHFTGRDLARQGWQMTSPPHDDFLKTLTPATDWASAGLHPALARNAHAAGWAFPRAVQSIMLAPNLPRDCDIVVSASTGCGKTGAYLLPLLRDVMELAARGVRHTVGLVVVNCLEMAGQVYAEVQKLSAGLGVNVLPILGTRDTHDEQRRAAEAMHGGVHVVVATIGRLCSALTCAAPFIDLRNLRHLVIDEADKISEGTLTNSHLAAIFRNLPRSSEYRTVVCSATLYAPLQKLCGWIEGYSGQAIIRKGAWMVSDSGPKDCKIPVYQRVEEVTRHTDRVDRAASEIIRYLQSVADGKVIVFARKKELETVCADLRRHVGGGIAVLHTSGDVGAEQRINALETFKTTRQPVILVSSYGTNGRGTDTDCGLVVLFHMPASFDEYKHAIGRTGRKREGLSLAFYSPLDQNAWEPHVHVKALIESSEHGGRHCWGDAVAAATTTTTTTVAAAAAAAAVPVPATSSLFPPAPTTPLPPLYGASYSAMQGVPDSVGHPSSAGYYPSTLAAHATRR